MRDRPRDGRAGRRCNCTRLHALGMCDDFYTNPSSTEKNLRIEIAYTTAFRSEYDTMVVVSARSARRLPLPLESGSMQASVFDGRNAAHGGVLTALEFRS
jgi:hypothetical protein